MAILRNLNSQGHTIIMVTHDPSIAAQAERVIEIKDGQILKDYYTDNRFDKTTEVQHLNFAKKSGVTAFLDRLSGSL